MTKNRDDFEQLLINIRQSPMSYEGIEDQPEWSEFREEILQMWEFLRKENLAHQVKIDLEQFEVVCHKTLARLSAALKAVDEQSMKFEIIHMMTNQERFDLALKLTLHHEQVRGILKAGFNANPDF